MEGISFDNIEIDETFLEDVASVEDLVKDPKTPKNTPVEEEIDDPFITPESVDAEEQKSQEIEDFSPENDEDPKIAKGLYSSIASALKAEGILSSIEPDKLDKIASSEDFVNLFNSELEARLSEEHKRIKAALDAGVEPTDIEKFEKTLKYLEDISSESLEEETPEAETLRKQLIYQDYVNRGFSHAKAIKEVEKTIAAGTDIEDAQEALLTNKEFYSGKYDAIIKENNAVIEAEKAKIKAEGEALKALIEKTDEPLKGISVDAVTKSLILKNLSVADVVGEDGKKRTPLQDYQAKNPQDFLYKLGVLFTLTDGFKDLDKVVKPKVKKETNTSLRDLEQALKNTKVKSGELNFVSAADILNDTESYAGVTLDI